MGRECEVEGRSHETEGRDQWRILLGYVVLLQPCQTDQSYARYIRTGGKDHKRNVA